MADRYERDRYDRERGYGREDRGMLNRAGDEVRSWFGDDEAARRRERDERESYRGGEYGRERGREYGRPYGSSDAEQRAWSGGEGEYRREPERGREDVRPRQDWNMAASRPVHLESDSRYGGSSPGGDSDRGARSFRSDHDRGTFGRSFDRAVDRGFRGSGYGDRNDRDVRNWNYQDVGSAASDYGYVGSYGGWTEGRGQFTGRGPKGYRRSDDRIREDVCDRLADDPHIDASDIEITVRDGEVTLGGFVRDRGDKRHAEDVTEHVSGVREVHNALRVNRGPNNPGDVIGLNSSPASGSTPSGTASSNKR